MTESCKRSLCNVIVLRLWTVEETQWFHGLAAPSSCSFPHFNEHSLSTFFFTFCSTLFFFMAFKLQSGRIFMHKIEPKKARLRVWGIILSIYPFDNQRIQKTDKKTTRARQKGGKLYWELFSILYEKILLLLSQEKREGKTFGNFSHRLETLPFPSSFIICHLIMCTRGLKSISIVFQFSLNIELHQRGIHTCIRWRLCSLTNFIIMRESEDVDKVEEEN